MPSIALPAELISLRQWVLWRYELREGQPTKVSYTAMGYRASPTNPQHWSEYGYLAELLRKRSDFAADVGFVFAAEDPFCGIDLDNCFPSDAAECAWWAAGILERFRDTYAEESPSGRGVKIWCRAKAPRCGRWPIGLENEKIEIYDRARFFAVTGRSNGVLALTDHQEDIEVLVAHLDEGRRQEPARVIPPIISQGERHNSLVSLAGTMWRRGMTPEAIEAALLITNEKQCDPPRTAGHIRQIVAGMQRWPR